MMIPIAADSALNQARSLVNRMRKQESADADSN
jgi:hypothetical protein